MVALTISLIVLVALTQVYTGTRQTNRIQEMQSSLTDDGRFALGMLQRVISQAGFRPTLNSELSATRLATPTSTSLTVTMAGDGANITNCDGGLVTSGVDYTATISFDTETHTLSCSTATASTNWIAPAQGGNGTEVVDFLVTYGIDTAASPATLNANYLCSTSPTNRDCVADSYVSALPAGVSANQIVAVKLCLVLRSEATNTGVQRSSAVKNCSNSDISGSNGDFKLYRTFQSTVLLRNR